MRKHKTPAAWLKSVADKSPETMLAVFDISEDLKIALCDVDAEVPGHDQAVKFWAILEDQLDDTRKAQRQVSVESRHLPKPYIMTLAESMKDRRSTHVLLRGDFKQKGDEGRCLDAGNSA